MSVVLRLMRAGAKKRPFYRVVAADSRRQRDGRFLEIVGHYDPLRTPHELVIEKDQVEKWLSRGAQPSEQVASLLRSTGMTWGRPTPATKKKAEAKAAPKAKRKVAAKPVSERKVKARAARATRKAAGGAKPKAASKAKA